MNIDLYFANMWLSSGALIIGLTVLVLGGEMLISGAAKIALRLRMSSLLIGLTVVAFGTSMPELFVSVNASFTGHSDIMLGNVVGSNIANIALVLAISALLSPLSVHFRKLHREILLVLGASLALLFLAWWGFFPRSWGLIFIVSLITYSTYSYRKEAALKKNKPHKPADQSSRLLITFLVLGGLLCMWFGSDCFIKGAVDIARFFGLSELIIGLTLAAVGTSLPELASSLSAVRRKEGDLLVGNIIGSNLFNILLVLGATASLKPFAIPQITLYRDLPIMIITSATLLPIALCSHQINRWHGAFLLTGYVVYIVTLC